VNTSAQDRASVRIGKFERIVGEKPPVRDNYLWTRRHPHLRLPPAPAPAPGASVSTGPSGGTGGSGSTGDWSCA